MPQQQPLLLDTFRRTDAPREAVQLQRVELDAPGAMLHAYRVSAATQPVVAPPAEDAAGQARDLLGRLRRDRGSPSTFEVDPTTL